MLQVWASAQVSQYFSSAWLQSLVERRTYDLSQLNVGQSSGFFFFIFEMIVKEVLFFSWDC